MDQATQTYGDARGPSREQVQAALERVSASEYFATAARAREFLQFVVAETLEGRGDRLKGYTIAISVFARPSDFDAQNNPLVRVEARRVRDRLACYYDGLGRHDSVRIELPRGGYRPVFTTTTRAAIPAPTAGGAWSFPWPLLRRAGAAWRAAVAVLRSGEVGGDPGRPPSRA